MNSELDLSKEYGIVLEGGGAKGAYQIGVWKAFLEYNVKIKGVAGVSVGALNGALICMGDYEKASRIWENIQYSQVMDVNDEDMEKLIHGKIRDLNLSKLTKEGVKTIKRGGIDASPLQKLIEEEIDEDQIRNSSIEFVLGTFSVSNLKEMNVMATQVETGYLKDYLLASSHLPIFKIEKLNGKKYLDGGVINNVPVDMLINRGYKNIIVIRIFGIGIEKKLKVPKDVNIIEIAPRVDLGNLLEFTNRKSRRNIMIGYFDGLRCLRGLTGRIYYIQSREKEEYYLEQLIYINKEAKTALFEWYKLDSSEDFLSCRRLLEVIFPNIASELKLDRKWTYKELYITMLEVAAKKYKIPKYKVYTELELLEAIREKYKNAKEEEKTYPNFIDLIIKTMIL